MHNVLTLTNFSAINPPLPPQSYLKNTTGYHLKSCPDFPKDLREEAEAFKRQHSGKATGKYWIESCQRKGLYDDSRGVILYSPDLVTALPRGVNGLPFVKFQSSKVHKSGRVHKLVVPPILPSVGSAANPVPAATAKSFPTCTRSDLEKAIAAAGRIQSADNSSVKEDLADAKPSPDDSAVVSDPAVPDPVQVAPPEVSSTPSTSAEKKKSKAKSERDPPRATGTLDTPEEASTPHISVKEDLEDATPHISVKKDLEDANSSALSADEVHSASGSAQAKAPEVAGEFHMAGKFVTSIHWNSSSSAEAVNALFDEAKKKALEHVQVDKS